MRHAIAIVVPALRLPGLVSAHTTGGFIHVLPVIVMAPPLIQGKGI